MEDTPMEVAAYPLTRRRDAWLWRLFATGASFFFFGIGGLILRVLVLPLLALLPGDAITRRHRARAAIGGAFYLHMQFMYRTRVLDFHIDGAERLGQPGQLIIANHPSLIDVIFLIAQMRQTNCVVKASLWDNPCMHGAVRAAQYISNNGSPEMLEQAADVLREGQTLVMFPEGTRTKPGCAPVFHRGAAAIALRGARVVTPVFISVTPTTLTKAEPWYRIPDRRVIVQLRVGADIDPAQFNDAPMPIASRRLNQHLHQLFLKELDAS
ncbi:lysophospholipid acyltransferase family protein [Rhodanobacter sp. L36]|uniref:lysophospholipid acyltransferase family protein n=1 Tax=Rhodanobacter sp. L36 TaxID=1747221 RepID=UPI0020B14652|nr:lysophospholipid acyltransferase family protein [Rhodanobacter sp. L36]